MMFDEIISLLFNPCLWSLPFASLLLLNAYQIFRHGVFKAKQPFVQYKRMSSINIVMFCFLALWSIYSLSDFDNTVRIYLMFCVLFAAYGTGELFYKVANIVKHTRQHGFLTWFLTAGYPLFFFFHNTPLYVFIKERFEQSWNLFIFFMVLQISFYAILRLPFFDFYVVRPEKPTESKICLTLYFLARASAVMGYTILLASGGTL